MTEGSADYVAEKVINALVPVSADFAGNLEIMSYNLGNHVKNDVTPGNAEEVFRNDYKDVSHADREDEYTLGRMICSFLEESYGESFLRDYIAALQKAGYVLYSDKYFNITDTERDEQTEIFKKVFGEDALKDFGTYYQTHKSE